MDIISKDVWYCQSCGNYRGSVEEKYNGKVPVHCVCTLEEEKIKYGGWRSPCMICPNGNKFFWTPISNHKESDGKSWHSPYFSPVEPFNRINKK